MTETNTDLLLPADLLESPYSAEDFNAVAKSNDFLRRLQLFGGNSDAVKTEKIAIGTWGLVTDSETIEPLQKQIDVMVCAWRPKAMVIDKAAGAVLSYFDPKSEIFQETQARSGEENSNCMYGPEFLVYYPPHDELVSYYMGSKTARQQSGKVLGLKGKAATLKIKLIEKGKFKWHGPVIVPCTTPLSRAPDTDKLKKELERFLTPKDSAVEVVDTGGTPEGERPR